MVSHDLPAEDGSAPLSVSERQQRTLRRLDDGHAALLDALAGLGEAEAFLGSRWSIWEVMQHLLTENFVAALEQIASGEREMLPAFDGRDDRIANDIARLEANYQRFRSLIGALSEAQLNLPATPYNPENDFPALSLLDLIERVSGHEGNHARQVVETRKYVAAFRSAERAVTVAGLGPGQRETVPLRTRELLGNADYVIGSPAALAVARPWIRAVELPLRADNREELINRLVRDIRAGLWSMVVTLGDPPESAAGLLSMLDKAVPAVSVIPAPGFYRLALEQARVSPLEAVCASVEHIRKVSQTVAAERATVVLGSDDAGTWRDAAGVLLDSGVAADTEIRLLTGLSRNPSVTTTTLRNVSETGIGDEFAAVDSALILR
jgi:precorrin-6B methylase 1